MMTKSNELMKSGVDTGNVERVQIEETYDPEIWYHTYRYRFAAAYVARKRVLDIACGQGYGSRSLLDRGAKSVLGVDICESAVQIAREKYGINAMVGSGTALPLPDECVDVVVSMETIEHLLEQDEFVAELHRVLVPGGMLLMSTPNHQVWLERNHFNPYHLKELYEHEFVELLEKRFVGVQLHTQGCIDAVPWSFRSLCTPQSIWRKMAGLFLKMDHVFRWVPRYWKLRQELASYARAGWDVTVPPLYKRDPVRLVNREGFGLAERLHQFRVRPRNRWSQEKFEYMVAVAYKPRA